MDMGNDQVTEFTSLGRRNRPKSGALQKTRPFLRCFAFGGACIQPPCVTEQNRYLGLEALPLLLHRSFISDGSSRA